MNRWVKLGQNGDGRRSISSRGSELDQDEAVTDRASKARVRDFRRLGDYLKMSKDMYINVASKASTR